MPNEEPIFNIHNLAIVFNVLFGLTPLLMLPYIMVSSGILVLVIFYDWPTLAGAVIVIMGAAYTFAAEFFFPSPTQMANEIRNDPMMLRIRTRPGSERALARLNCVLDFSERSNRLVSRSTETLLLVGGGIIGIIGIVQDKLH
ncbi:hypothetical protein ASC80_07910 [Afipia sp. Root123D2]|uniref:hypothetical protein n=1 Tax=Afipia sp. Root123D2 TaxID=1736436 RepID=UPI000701C3D7|nr:hypothetical protein [Afipia sp. Root123D2]KQW23206.1 hypothetical protein ASC80_07910 [Afipia sp. Root123D2]